MSGAPPGRGLLMINCFAAVQLAVQSDLVAVPVADLLFVFPHQRPFGAGVFAQDIPDPGSRKDLDRLFIHFYLHM